MSRVLVVDNREQLSGIRSKISGDVQIRVDIKDLTPEEIDPPFDSGITLADSETGEDISISFQDQVFLLIQVDLLPKAFYLFLNPIPQPHVYLQKKLFFFPESKLCRQIAATGSGWHIILYSLYSAIGSFLILHPQT